MSVLLISLGGALMGLVSFVRAMVRIRGACVRLEDDLDQLLQRGRPDGV